MYEGNANGDGEINIKDKNAWSIDATKRGYYPGDMDFNSQVNNQDKNDVWLPNNTLTDQVPD